MVPIFPALAASTALKSIIGTNPVRAYAFGLAPQNGPLPYLVWQIVGGLPENYLGDRPDMDGSLIQIDIYGKSAAIVRDAAIAARDAIEGVAYVTSWRGESIDPDTKNHRFSFDTDWLTPR